ncbi:MAG TPA: class I SAM-dependent methyltransferase [Planctomycetota bacterium]|nr:class I SAM-dependent methyltransferase [Planctomycetota bacterium]
MARKRVSDVSQAETEYYCDKRYNDLSRFVSYGYQLKELWALNPQRVLEIGVGNGVLSYVLRRSGVRLTTLDVEADLQPDVVASVDDMPLADNQFDVVTCFEVLEHLPFEDLPVCLREMHRTTTGHVLITLPDITPFWRMYIPRIGLKSGRLLLSIPFVPHRKTPRCAHHYWEIGVQDYPLRKVRAAIRLAGLRIHRCYRIWENPYHRMFVLAKLQQSNGSSLSC